MTTLNLQSRQTSELIDLTDKIRAAAASSGIREGMVLVYTPHTTAAITINENADPDVITDIINGLNQIVPSQGNYRHLEGNSAAHIKSSLVGASETLIIAEGKLVLGTWQGIFFCEFDGPRRRKVHVQVLGA
ncbi:MAG: secondary thiamine-phosphate synthase enzyme YjbQ [Desulfuromonadales bacterium]|jgi:secondary thiamine-phosphate synthase enzyme|nr:secondary thiamine-phosphate synthase enzyme YjbQ [Desulfuromonadales bacterium]